MLIVDDEVAVVEALTEILSSEGAKVLSASNGSEGLRVLEMERPDSLVVDYMMPIMNGVEFCKAARRLDWATGIPIVLISAAGVPATDGAVPWNLFLRKPFNMESLFDALEEAHRATPLPR